MLKNTAKAKKLFEEEKWILVLCKGEKIIKSNAPEIQALLKLIEENGTFQGYCCACDIIGKSAAILFAKAGIREIYCNVLSSSGKTILAKNGISVYYHTLTDIVKFEPDSDICPIETAVANITNPELGFSAIKKAVEAFT